MYRKIFIFILLSSIHSIFTLHATEAVAVPLSTDSRWIVDAHGRRVKLTCVNWAAHLDTAVAEGLSKSPATAVSKRILEMGFNCVRLTWPLYLATNDTLAATSVREQFNRVGVSEAVGRIRSYNPDVVDVSLFDAFQAVVSTLGKNNVMVILDNHISKPGWCCSDSDGNGFFGDPEFDPELWVQGLSKMATTFKGTPNVVAMSLRNELRGPRQNVTDWYRYMQKGAEAVHAANTNLLVILSGLSYDTDLSFLRNRPVTLPFAKKAVYEFHWYSFSDASAWTNSNPNQVCGSVTGRITGGSEFLLDQGYPLFMSEFGMDLRGKNVDDNRYFTCLMGRAAELDLDWALWSLVGSYYIREGVVGLEEYYGVLNKDWNDVRNSSFLKRISLLQSPLQGPGLSESDPHNIVFHPFTGLCILRASHSDSLALGPCSESEPWTYTPEKTLAIQATNLCLRTDGLDKPAKLSLDCSNPGTTWAPISESGMHLGAQIGVNMTACLDVDSNKNIITTTMCKCLNTDANCDPESQWFKIVNSTRKYSSVKNFNSFVKPRPNRFKRLFGNWT